MGSPSAFETHETYKTQREHAGIKENKKEGMAASSLVRLPFFFFFLFPQSGGVWLTLSTPWPRGKAACTCAVQRRCYSGSFVRDEEMGPGWYTLRYCMCPGLLLPVLRRDSAGEWGKDLTLQTVCRPFLIVKGTLLKQLFK